MKNKRPAYRFNAFSILEVTVVIALMALLSALFFGALNRFNEQVRNETIIKNELNNWFLVRSNLWRELDEADSVIIANNAAVIWTQRQAVAYSIENELLIRRKGELIQPMNIEMTAIRSEQRGNYRYAAFVVRWKNSDMTLSYPLKSGISDRINTYFLAKQWPS